MPTSGWAPAPRPCVDLHAELDAAVGLGEGQLLGVGVGDDELDALEPRLDHVVDGVAAGAADAEHDDARAQLLHRGRSDIDAHAILSSGRRGELACLACATKQIRGAKRLTLYPQA